MTTRGELPDIVERLRERARIAREENTGTALGDALHFEEAAAEIDRLRATPPGSPLERKVIARALFDHWKIKNPSYDYVVWSAWYRNHWLGFADAILATPSPSPTEREGE